MDQDDDSHKWEEKDLVALIGDQVEEGPSLDYKGPDSLQNTPERKKELSKDVTAFANSAGGTIIYGIKEDQTKRVPERIAGVDPKDISKEWIEHVVAGNTQPRPAVHIHSVSLPKADPGKVAYVLVIPPGETAYMSLPHRQYFKRYEFQSVPMSDFEIRDVMNRRRHPILEVKFSTKQREIVSEGEHHYRLKILLINRGSTVIQNWKLLFRVPTAMHVQSGGYAPSRIITEEESAEFETSASKIIFPQDELELGAARVRMTSHIRREIMHKGLCLTWRLYADDMPYKEGSIPLLELISF